MILITTQGEYEFTTSTGMVRRLSIGSIVIVEDISGKGHLFKVVGSKDVMVLGLGLRVA